MAQVFQGPLRQGHITIGITFAGADVQEHPFPIDVRHLQAQTFTQAQAAGINGDQGHPMIQQGDVLEDAPDLRGREDHGQFVLGVGPDQLDFAGPGAVEGFLPEELEGAQDLGGGLPGDFLFGLEVDAILAELLSTDLVGGFLIMLAELAHTGPASLFGARADGQKFQIIGEGF